MQIGEETKSPGQARTELLTPYPHVYPLSPSLRPKFIFVGYLPKAAPVMKRARCGGHKAEVKKSFHSIHVEFQIEDASEISKDEVVSKLRLSGGAHQPTSYEFGPMLVGTHAA